MKRLAIEEVSDGEESEEEEELTTEEVAVGWGETSVALPTEPTGEFVACPKWGGPLPGHFFGTGDKGTGYYPDPLANPEPARASPPSTVPQPTAPVERKRIAIEEDSDDEEGEVEVKEEVTAVEDEMEEEVAAMEAMKEEVVEEVEPEENSLQVQADSYRASGNEAFAKGEYLVAADTFSRALRLTPACPVLLNNRAACRLKMGETDLAEQDAGTAVALDPCYGKAWNRLGGCHKALGKLEGAAAAFQNALAHVPAPAKRGVEKDLAEVRKLIAARKKRRAARSATTFGADSIEYKKGAVVIEELDSDDDDESEGEEEGEGHSKAVGDEFKAQAEVRRGKAKQAEAEWEARRRGWEERVAAVEALHQKVIHT
jgi:protein involved in ribonucleotide reduction